MDNNNNKRVYHRKANGTTYVYEIVKNYWDKGKQQSRNKQVCIGKLDPITGEFIPSKRLGDHGAASLNSEVTASTIITGPALILRRIDQSIGLSKVLKKASPENWDSILALAWYIVCTGKALAQADVWSRQHEVPTDKNLDSQRISELLSELSEDERQSFFKIWGKKVASQDYLCYDITSISSYAEANEYVRYGYNRDRESLPQINLAMIYGQKSSLPVTFRELPGSINDVVTVEYLLDRFDKLEFPRVHFVMDRGFYSQSNLDSLFDARQHFTIAVPAHLKWIKCKIDENLHLIDSPYGLKEVEGEQIYAHTVLHSWGPKRRRCYLHFYYDPQKQVDDHKSLDSNLLKWKNELLTEQRIPEHEEYYEHFFTVKRTPKRGLNVTMNWEAVEAARKQYAGFRVILSTNIKDNLEALKIYRNKDVVEKCFDDLKNELDMKRLRVHNSGRMKSRLFIQFIALILLSQIRKVMREQDLLGKYTARSLIMEMESLTTIYYSGKYKNKMSEATKVQREILKAFGIEYLDA
jgi:transposase